jgi:hypothetical protein
MTLPVTPSGCSPRWAVTERSRFFTGAFRAVSTPTAASTASRSASVRASPVVPAGAERSRASSSAGLRRPQ